MQRKIIKIDEESCVGCGLCAKTCKQSAIEMVNGKAKVTRDDYCDGIGNCLPVCPVNAISFSDEDIKEKPISHRACPGSMAVELPNNNVTTSSLGAKSALRQWPVQIKLVPVTAPYFNGADLLIAADCSAFSYANFHSDFMQNKVTIIGCPKLDEGDYTDKLTEIITKNNLKSITVVRMEVPCCGGIERATLNAISNSGKFVPHNIVTISTGGNVL